MLNEETKEFRMFKELKNNYLYILNLISCFIIIALSKSLSFHIILYLKKITKNGICR